MAQARVSVPQAAAARTPWRITVHNIEACNCSPGCNCQFTGFPDTGNCEAMIGGEVREGTFGDVVARGRAVRHRVHVPEGDPRGERADAPSSSTIGRLAAQADAIAAILSGQAGGMPFEALAGTVASLDGPVLRADRDDR